MTKPGAQQAVRETLRTCRSSLVSSPSTRQARNHISSAIKPHIKTTETFRRTNLMSHINCRRVRAAIYDKIPPRRSRRNQLDLSLTHRPQWSCSAYPHAVQVGVNAEACIRAARLSSSDCFGLNSTCHTVVVDALLRKPRRTPARLKSWHCCSHYFRRTTRSLFPGSPPLRTQRRPFPKQWRRLQQQQPHEELLAAH